MQLMHVGEPRCSHTTLSLFCASQPEPDNIRHNSVDNPHQLPAHLTVAGWPAGMSSTLEPGQRAPPSSLPPTVTPALPLRGGI